jgi:hypothetical protein
LSSSIRTGQSTNLLAHIMMVWRQSILRDRFRRASGISLILKRRCYLACTEVARLKVDSGAAASIYSIIPPSICVPSIVRASFASEELLATLRSWLTEWPIASAFNVSFKPHHVVLIRSASLFVFRPRQSRRVQPDSAKTIGSCLTACYPVVRNTGSTSQRFVRRQQELKAI